MIRSLQIIYMMLFASSMVSGQVVIKMEMPQQSDIPLTAVTLFDENLPLGIPSVLGTAGYEIYGGAPPYNYNWLENENIISDQNTVMITPALGSSYSFVIIDVNHCTDTVSISTEKSVGIEPVNGTEEPVSAFLIASRRSIQVVFSQPPSGDVRVQLIDIRGTLSFEIIINDNAEIPLRVENGFYLLRILNDKFHYVKKIVVR